MTGTVLSSTNNISRVLCDDTIIRSCGIKGKRIKTLTGMYNSLAVGDVVEVAETDPGKGLITSLRERKNTFGRYNEKGRAEQSIAANVDLVCCVTSPAFPPFRPRFIDRLTVLSDFARVPFLIILNKIDSGIPEQVEERLAGYKALGYEVKRVSALTGEGLSDLTEYLSGKTCVLAGQSGVGKSSIMNAMIPGLDRKTQEVSFKYDRGKHTTTMAEMILAGSTRIIDTPGIRRLAVRGIDPDELAGCFPEMAPLVSSCSFGSRCTHLEEEGCAILAAVRTSSIHPDRYESYCRIREELVVPPQWKRSGNRDPGRKDRGLPQKSRKPGKQSWKHEGFDHDDHY